MNQRVHQLFLHKGGSTSQQMDLLV
jgi:hypothetical protein